ncbi:MAG: HAMP domain-containing histidine kinase [Bdellovibrionales bacterium]|nr:HAMP domain-containing histidine kinase [Bdellovibrionales bacterium]
MNENLITIKLVYSLFGATVLLAFVMSLFQLYFERKRIYFYSSLYWFSILFNSAINIIAAQNQSTPYVILAISTFAGELVLATVMTSIQDISVKIKSCLLVFVVFLLIYLVLTFLKVSDNISSFTLLIGATYPVFQAAYFGFKNKTRKLTSGQILFFGAAVIMSIHFLDYPFFKSHETYFALASAIAFFLVHVLASLMPMVVTEYDLYLKNKNLEIEIQKRIQELRKKDQQVLESEKLASIGRLSGILAHELNTPLSSISTATNNILKQYEDPTNSDDIIVKNSHLIKKVISQISQITTLLKTASGDQVGLSLTKINLPEILKELEEYLVQTAQVEKVKLDIQFEFNEPFIQANAGELIQVIKMAYSSVIFSLKNSSQPKVKIGMHTSQGYLKLVFEGTSEGQTAEITKESEVIHNLDLNFVVIKSIMEAHKGYQESEITNNKAIISLSFPV